MDRTLALADDWPRTSRLMPWLIAALLVVIFLTPMDSTKLPVNMPVDCTPDRVILAIMVGVWLCGALSDRRFFGPLKRTWVSISIFLFVVVATTSILVNVDLIEQTGVMSEGIKRLAVLLSYAILFILVATSLRKSELRAFGTFLVCLASLTALGTIVEYRTEFNVFYYLGQKLAFGGITVLSPLQAVSLAGTELTSHSRHIVGPAEHGLAVCTMMAFALPIAIIRLLDAERAKKLLWAGVTGLIIAGSVATLRKTGLILPVVVVVVLSAYRPMAMLRVFLPVGLVLVVLIQLLAPSALSTVVGELTPESNSTDISTRGRLQDYGAVRPNVLTRPAIGQGFGTYLHQTNRYLDNEYLKRLLETGLLGVLTYMFMVVAVMMVAHRSIRSGDPIRAGPALAASAGACAYGVAGFLYDEFFFPQAPYLFFLAAAIVVVAAAPTWSPARVRRRARPTVAAASPSGA
jgi:hypothetical protein